MVLSTEFILNLPLYLSDIKRNNRCDLNRKAYNLTLNWIARIRRILGVKKGPLLRLFN